MKWLFILSICLLICNGLIGQEVNSKKESRKEISQKKKAEQLAKMDSVFRLTDTILTGRKFVLEADHLSNARGAQKFVTPNLNFISVDSLRAIIQVGSPGQAGYNGVGGVTVDGKLSNWKFTKNEKQKSFCLFMTVQANFGIYDITMMVDYSGNADATITGLRAGRLTFTGNIVPREDSFIFKGQSH